MEEAIDPAADGTCETRWDVVSQTVMLASVAQRSAPFRWSHQEVLQFARAESYRSMAMLLIAIAATVALSNANKLRLALQSRGWPTVHGRVDETATRDPEWTINGVGPDRWQDVLYRYSVDGKYFTASQKYFTGWSENWWRAINHSAPAYEAGADVLVRYHPDDPRLAVLEPGVPLGLAADYVISVILAVSGTWLWLAA